MARKVTTIKFPPDIQQWLDEVTDKEKFPLGPYTSQLITEAVRAYMPVVNLTKRDFKPRRPDAVILAEKAANDAKLAKRRK